MKCHWNNYDSFKHRFPQKPELYWTSLNCFEFEFVTDLQIYTSESGNEISATDTMTTVSSYTQTAVYGNSSVIPTTNTQTTASSTLRLSISSTYPSATAGSSAMTTTAGNVNYFALLCFHVTCIWWCTCSSMFSFRYYPTKLCNFDWISAQRHKGSILP